MCEHQIDTKIENGIVITFCRKCGQILDTKMVQAPTITCSGFTSNGGQILHD